MKGIKTAKGLSIVREYPLSVMFRAQNVGQFYADILVDHCVIIELKAVSVLNEIHKAQILNYLKATGIAVGLLVNFGAPKLEYRRFENRFLPPVGENNPIKTNHFPSPSSPPSL